MAGRQRWWALLRMYYLINSIRIHTVRWFLGSARSEEEANSVMEAAGTSVEERRRSKRQYMRAWRSNPGHLARHRVQRRIWEVARKLRNADVAMDPGTSALGKPICGCCGKRSPVTHVTRLRIGADGRFKHVEIPYCGIC
jgi:hypothetical protein